MVNGAKFGLVGQGWFIQRPQYEIESRVVKTELPAQRRAVSDPLAGSKQVVRGGIRAREARMEPMSDVERGTGLFRVG